MDTEIAHALVKRLAGLLLQHSEAKFSDQEGPTGEFPLVGEGTHELAYPVGVATAAGRNDACYPLGCRDDRCKLRSAGWVTHRIKPGV